MESILPRHVAIIMDGNRRWARERGLPSFEGHRKGVQRVQELLEELSRLEVGFCTLWAFSTENWKRDAKEVGFLMKLFEEYLHNHLDELNKKNVQLKHIGRKDRLPKSTQKLFAAAEAKTAQNSGTTLFLAVDYGGRDEILRAVEKACAAGKTHWTEADFSVLLDTAGAPDPDLIIRTSGEQRLSGFLLWQSCYSELYFTQTCFPDFTVQEFHKALEEYSKRTRTLGA